MDYIDSRISPKLHKFSHGLTFESSCNITEDVLSNYKWNTAAIVKFNEALLNVEHIVRDRLGKTIEFRAINFSTCELEPSPAIYVSEYSRHSLIASSLIVNIKNKLSFNPVDCGEDFVSISSAIIAHEMGHKLFYEYPDYFNIPSFNESLVRPQNRHKLHSLLSEAAAIKIALLLMGPNYKEYLAKFTISGLDNKIYTEMISHDIQSKIKEFIDFYS